MPEENKKKYDMQKSSYFNSLTPYVRETLVQSGGLIESDEDRRDAADKRMGDY